MNTSIKKDIITALSDSAVLFTEHGGLIRPHYTPESDYVMYVAGFSKIVEKVIRTDEKLFSIKKARFDERKYIALTKLGEQLQVALRTDVPGIRQSFPLHELNPYFELLVEQAKERDLDYWVAIREAMLKDEITKASDTLHGLVNALREEGRSAKFKAKLRRFHRSANKNCQSLTRYLRKTLAHHARINIRRFDLAYQMDEVELTVQPGVTNHQTAKMHREALLKALKKSELSKYVIGYAWKMEHSSAKGFLHHLLLILDEESVENESTIDPSLREMWDEVTTSTGLLVNCKTLPTSFKSEGIGLMDNSNKDAATIVRKLCTYLTQTDNYLKLNLPDGARTFGKAEFVEKKNNSVTSELPPEKK